MKRMIGVILAIAVASGCAAGAQARPTAGGPLVRHLSHRSADVTFTKWVTGLPANPSATLAGATMVGVVGGDVGEGTYAGIVVKDDATSQPGFWLAQALYGFFGSDHSFVVNTFITENDTVSPPTATIHGVVILGWMKGAHVTGEYTVIGTCPIPTPGNVFGSVCFQGTLHLRG